YGSDQIHMGARLFDPSTGRFTSRDPEPGAPTSPQSQNPYAYGLNAPGRYYDLDGRFAEPLVATCVDPVQPLCWIGVGGTIIGVGAIVFVNSDGGEGVEDLGDDASDALGKGPKDEGPGANEKDPGKSPETSPIEPSKFRGATVDEVDVIARRAGYEVRPGKLGGANPATRYYKPGTNRSEGFRVRPRGVDGQGGLKGGPYVKFFGGKHHGKRIPLKGNSAP
ncbi:MAG: RHS repeat-associated core domain-containing protein, partial [Solirubrobacterales bacterium]